MTEPLRIMSLKNRLRGQELGVIEVKVRHTSDQGRSSKLMQCFERINWKSRAIESEQARDVQAFCCRYDQCVYRVDLQPQSGAMFIDHAKIEITRRSVGARCGRRDVLPPINGLRGIEGRAGSINISCLAAL
jgi:hypothetical protein